VTCLVKGYVYSRSIDRQPIVQNKRSAGSNEIDTTLF